MTENPVLRSVFRNRYLISEERLAICRQCEHYDASYRKCLKCGCFMEYKTLLPWAECPLHKWESKINTTEKENE